MTTSNNQELTKAISQVFAERYVELQKTHDAMMANKDPDSMYPAMEPNPVYAYRMQEVIHLEAMVRAVLEEQM